MNDPLAYSTALLTDRYELTMVSSLLAEGKAEVPAVFEAFTRRLPEGRRYGVVAGISRLAEAVRDFRFSSTDVEYLLSQGIVDERTADYLAGFAFTGHIDAYADGDLFFPYSPLVSVRAPLAEGLLLETIILSILNHDCAVASAAARMVVAACGKPVLELGSRRTHELAAPAAAYAAYLAGFEGTSNLAAGYRWGIPTFGTAAHAFILAHESEAVAFAAQVAAFGTGTTLLVDTYDTLKGVRTAIEVAGPGLGAVRIDSGDLAVVSRQVRELLDLLGASSTKIVATSDLDEYVIAALVDGPVDAFGAGTRVVTGSGHPTASLVYKLVALADGPAGSFRSVAKASSAKVSLGGAKAPFRTYSSSHIEAERFALVDPFEPFPLLPGRPLHTRIVEAGQAADLPSLQESRAFHAAERAKLPPSALAIAAGAPAFEAAP